MRRIALVIVVLCASLPARAQAWPSPQQPDVPGSLPASPAQPSSRADALPPPDDSSATAAPRSVSWKTIVPNLASDQKRIWLFPVGLATGRHWKPALAVVAVTAGLIALDPTDTPYFRRTTTFQGFNKVASSRNTDLAIGLLPGSWYAVGLMRRDSYAQQTALFAGEAILDSEIVAVVMKDIDRRLRPAAVPPNGDFSDTWFRDHSSLLRGTGSFPSGHSIAAFSVATVFARRYSRHRWVPWVAYGAAGFIGFSRLTLSAHFPSDVFMGAALGYSISRFGVLRQ
jgi:membrane-associated phospholipid phosphatase